MSGIVLSVTSRQKGHCRSANSTTRTGAFASPSTRPFCGMPASRALVALAPLTDDAVRGAAFEPEPEAEIATSTATTIAAAPSTAPRRVRRRRRAAAAASAASRSTRSWRAASRRCLRVGWATVGMAMVLLRASIGRPRTRPVRGNYGLMSGAPAISGRRRSPEDRGERGRRRSGGRRAGPAAGAGRRRTAARVPRGRRGRGTRRASRTRRSEPTYRPAASGRSSSSAGTRDQRVRGDARDAMRDGGRQDGGGHRAQDEPIADAHHDPG